MQAGTLQNLQSCCARSFFSSRQRQRPFNELSMRRNVGKCKWLLPTFPRICAFKCLTISYCLTVTQADITANAHQSTVFQDTQAPFEKMQTVEAGHHKACADGICNFVLMGPQFTTASSNRELLPTNCRCGKNPRAPPRPSASHQHPETPCQCLTRATKNPFIGAASAVF